MFVPCMSTDDVFILTTEMCVTTPCDMVQVLVSFQGRQVVHLQHNHPHVQLLNAVMAFLEL